jgi:hypothetical protein
VFDTYGIKQKVDYLITDNAANMHKAFTVAFGNDENDVEVDDDMDVESPEGWENLDSEIEDEILSAASSHVHKERLSCFGHTIHLVVGDGLKDTKCVSLRLAKSCKVSSMLHSSYLFRDAFVKVFGPDVTISAAVSTRRNSTLQQLK